MARTGETHGRDERGGGGGPEDKDAWYLESLEMSDDGDLGVDVDGVGDARKSTTDPNGPEKRGVVQLIQAAAARNTETFRERMRKVQTDMKMQDQCMEHEYFSRTYRPFQ